MFPLMHKYHRTPDEEVLDKKDLLIKLSYQIEKINLIAQSDVYIKNLDGIYQTLELIDEEKDPFVHAMVGGYVREFVTTFLVLYYGTNDLEKSLKSHSLIKALTKYIVLLDRHYDEKNYEYKVRADAIFKKIMSKVDGYIKHSIMHGMATLWATATYEINLRERMFRGEVFHKKEIRNHIFLKSSDTELYGIILDEAIDSFNPNVMQIIHYNQALLDIQDDLNDLEEDILRHDLNVFIMAACHHVSLDDIYSGKVKPKDVVKHATVIVQGIIADFEECILSTLIPKEYAFLKMLSVNYIRTVSKDLVKSW